MSHKANILYIWKSPYPWDVRVEKICSALRDAGFSVTILARCGDGQLPDEIIDGMKIIRVGCGLPWMLSNPISLNPVWKNAINKAIELEKPDIIIPREIMLAEAAAFSARKKDIPVIMDMAEHYPAAMKSWKKYQENIIRKVAVHYLDLPEKTESQSIPLMDGIITVCKEQNQRLNDAYAFPEEIMQVVHNTPSKQAYEKIRLDTSMPPKVFGHHGWMSSDKNILNLVKGFDIAAEQFAEIELLLAGDGEDFEEIKSAVDSAKNKNRITLTGRYNQEDLPDILSKIDVGCLPYEVNLFNDHTLHNKLFDYLACGKPIICSNTRPFVRIIKETDAGIATDCSTPKKVANAIESIMKSDVRSFSQNAKTAAISKYNWEIDKVNLISFINLFI
jgi:glycosyltransferase involved in cell wall biosynthesis